MMGLSRQETSEQPVANHPMRRKTKMKHKISENPGHKSSKRQLHLLLKEMVDFSALVGLANGFPAFPATEDELWMISAGYHTDISFTSTIFDTRLIY